MVVINGSIDHLQKKGTAKGDQDMVNQPTPLPKKGRRQETKATTCNRLFNQSLARKKGNSKGGPRHRQSANSSPPRKGEDRKQRPPLAIDRSFD